MEARIYQTSKRLGPISHDQFSRVLTKHHIGELIAAEPVPFGLFGQNVFLASSTGQFVFRGAPHGPGQFPTEQFFTRLLHERTRVPVPWPYIIDDSCDIFPWGYVIMPRMPGLQVTDPAVKKRLSKADRLAIGRAMGRNLAAMHQITAPVCARFDPERGVVRAVPLRDQAAWPWHGSYGDVDEPPAHHEIVPARIRFLLDRALGAGDCTTQADADWVEKTIAQASNALREPFTPCLVIEDYKEGNAVVRRFGDDWEVSGVFDFMGCYFGDGEADLSRTVAEYFDGSPELVAAFVRTYLGLRPPRPGFAARFAVYMLLDRIIIWEYLVRQEPNVARNLGGLRRWAERYLEIALTLALEATDS
jgi:aminoglycoside phosphotransferase (APT) family kinase protein